MNEGMSGKAGLLIGAMVIFTPLPATAFDVVGTSTLDVTADSAAEPGVTSPRFSVSAVAGFKLEADDSGETVLRGFTEFGPGDLVAGGLRGAGQIWVDVPGSWASNAIDAPFDDSAVSIYVGYQEWNSEAELTFVGAVIDGWFDVDAAIHGDAISAVDMRFNLTLEDEETGERRVVQGELFAGQPDGVATPSGSPSPPTATPSGGVGCAGDDYPANPAYEYDDPGPASTDDYDGCTSEPANGDEGCAGDDLDSSPSSDSGGCTGDRTDDSADSDGDTADCEGDNLAVGVGLPEAAARHIHLWAPLLYIILGRRRFGEVARRPLGRLESSS